MTKLTAIANVVAWSLFWVFGGLALLAPSGDPLVVPSTMIAFMGFAMGSFLYLDLRRQTYATLMRQG